MASYEFAQYVPPRTVREYKFSVRLSEEDHIRLLWWARNCRHRRYPASRRSRPAFHPAVPGSRRRTLRRGNRQGQPQPRAAPARD